MDSMGDGVNAVGSRRGVSDLPCPGGALADRPKGGLSEVPPPVALSTDKSLWLSPELKHVLTTA